MRKPVTRVASKPRGRRGTVRDDRLPIIRGLAAKIADLPIARIREIDDYVDFLRWRTEDRDVDAAFKQANLVRLSRIWDNPDDASYDEP